MIEATKLINESSIYTVKTENNTWYNLMQKMRLSFGRINFNRPTHFHFMQNLTK